MNEEKEWLTNHWFGKGDKRFFTEDFHNWLESKRHWWDTASLKCKIFEACSRVALCKKVVCAFLRARHRELPAILLPTFIGLIALLLLIMLYLMFSLLQKCREVKEDAYQDKAPMPILIEVNADTRVEQDKDPPVTPPIEEPPVTPPIEDPPVTPPEKDPPVTPPKKDPPVTPPKKDPPVTPPKKDPPVTSRQYHRQSNPMIVKCCNKYPQFTNHQYHGQSKPMIVRCCTRSNRFKWAMSTGTSNILKNDRNTICRERMANLLRAGMGKKCKVEQRLRAIFRDDHFQVPHLSCQTPRIRKSKKYFVETAKPEDSPPGNQKDQLTVRKTEVLPQPQEESFVGQRGTQEHLTEPHTQAVQVQSSLYRENALSTWGNNFFGLALGKPCRVCTSGTKLVKPIAYASEAKLVKPIAGASEAKLVKPNASCHKEPSVLISVIDYR